MKHVRACWFLAVAVASLALAPAAAPAMPVCSVSNTTTLTFDTVYDGSRPNDGRAGFVVTCTRTQTTTISLIYSHRLDDGSARPLHYDLFATPDRSVVWGSGHDGAPVAQTFAGGRPTTVYIYARIPPNQQPLPGNFSDSLEIVTMP